MAATLTNEQETHCSPAFPGIHTSGSPAKPDIPSPQGPSEMEAKYYYYGLYSAPVLVARTSTAPWEVPGPEAFPKAKELRTVGNHTLQKVWEESLAPKLHAVLDSTKVDWTCTDVVRVGYTGESSAPVILWIGVVPASLSGDDGVVVAFKCLEVIREYDIADIEVEIRESVVTRTAGPKFLTTTHFSDPTLDIREPLTTTLGLSICAQATPRTEVLSLTECNSTGSPSPTSTSDLA
ncbi:uncharacterized protein PHACADRAFT_24643 [Phanerochaete carnosa HHB-10118-sp]|uniref:Uncharacterized protein n=1 Tax=Phanerochaete carnosa (strain HHB-10118-sp) TaxID=650164 RepID=K5WBY1_PHACS|nr:uncharacterized protein PHACADRAFT_24643 [Phanerochaete carnosa HHB-10118-sp]EKM61448.1 hypothetical protein PHACADRAFT_24643 [Phanerochaete carnosa HHB-10118-sp]